MTCETCGAVAVAWAMARGYCGPCWLGTFADDDVTLCGSCSDDMGDAFDAWPSDAGELAAGDRVPCGKCGA